MAEICKKGTAHNSASLQQRPKPRRPCTFPRGRDMGPRGLAGVRHRPTVLRLPCLTLSLSLSQWEIYSHGQKIKVWGWRQTAGSLCHTFQMSEWRDFRQDEVSSLCKVRKILLTLSICEQEDFLGLGYSLLLFKFLVTHLLSLLTELTSCYRKA